MLVLNETYKWSIAMIPYTHENSTIMSLPSSTSEITGRDKKKSSKFSVVTAIIIGIPPLLLVAGSVLSLPHG